MTLLVCGINHKTASITIRERFTHTSQEIVVPLLGLIKDKLVHEAAMLFTCNRTEVYCESDDTKALIDWLAECHQMSVTQLTPHAYMHHEAEAIRHMMRVACGLDSMVLGEPQILGQMKQAYATACQAGVIGPRLGRLFPHVFSVTKRVRTDTAIGVNPISVAYVSVDLAKQIFSNFSQTSVLLIGAGETIALVAKHFKDQGVQQLAIANRSVVNAKTLADQFGALSLALDDIGDYLQQADIVVSATSYTLPILGKGCVERAIKARKHRPMLMVDIAVPRDIEPEVGELDDVFLYNIDELQYFIDKGIDGRKQAALRAEEIIEVEMHRVMQEQKALEVVSSICAYRERVDVMRDNEVAKAMSALQAGEDPTNVIQSLATRLSNKVMHDPCVNLRKLASEGQEDLLRLACQLLGIEDK